MDSKFIPSTFWGGTWERVSGRFLYGSEDNVTGNKGGEKTHILTVSEMPLHDHEQYVTSNSGTDGIRRDFTSDGNCSRYPQCRTSGTGGGTSHNNMPPYYVAYIWRRTA